MSNECMSLPPLKPCPFCGGEAEVVGNERFVDVYCKNVFCRGFADSLTGNTAKDAIKAWNRRAGETD